MTDVQVPTLDRRIDVAGDTARLLEDGTVVREIEIKPLPEQFTQWQLDYKRRIYDAIEKNDEASMTDGAEPLNDGDLDPEEWSEDSSDVERGIH